MSHLSKNSENYYEYKHFSQCTIHKPDRNSVKTLCSVIRTKIKHSLWKYKQHQRRDCTEFSKLIDQNIHRKTKKKTGDGKRRGKFILHFLHTKRNQVIWKFSKKRVVQYLLALHLSRI